MRDIKFRAWDKLEKRIGEVNYIKYNKAQYDHVSVRFKQNKKTIDEGFNYWNEDGCNNIILMQFIGLKDTNGKDIYEGDIIKSTVYREKYGIVSYGKYKQVEMSNVYECGNLGFYIEFNDELQIIRKDIYFWHGVGIEVIGNIYENPELLKK